VVRAQSPKRDIRSMELAKPFKGRRRTGGSDGRSARDQILLTATISNANVVDVA
jgi:hypothetical protein